MRAEQLWRNVLERLQMRLPKSTYNTWLAGTTAELTEEGLSVYVESVAAFEWLEHRLRSIIQETINAEADGDLALRFVIQSSPPPAAERKINLPPPPSPPPSLQAGPPSLDLLSASEILTTTWPEPVWAVPGFLPVGVTILAGHPKIGKSWLTLQIAKAVALGQQTLGEHVERGGVLYLALEDSPVRLQNRMIRQAWPTNFDDLPLYFMLSGPFTEQIGDLASYQGSIILAEYIKHYRPRLVVVDTLSMAFGGDQNVVNVMTDALSPIRDMAHSFNAAVLLVDHHTKKTNSPDAVHNILGSIAKSAVADTAMGLYRQRGESYARLLITGRDIEDRLLAIRFNHGEWEVEGEAASIEITARRQELLEIIHELGPCQLSDIQHVSEQDRSNIFRRLRDLVQAGLVDKSDEGKKKLYNITPEGKKQIEL